MVWCCSLPALFLLQRNKPVGFFFLFSRFAFFKLNTNNIQEAFFFSSDFFLITAKISKLKELQQNQNKTNKQKMRLIRSALMNTEKQQQQKVNKNKSIKTRHSNHELRSYVFHNFFAKADTRLLLTNGSHLHCCFIVGQNLRHFFLAR